MKKTNKNNQRSISARAIAIIAAAALSISMAGCASSSETTATQEGQTDMSGDSSTQAEASDGATETTSAEETGTSEEGTAGTSSGAAYTEDTTDAYTALLSVNENTGLPTEISTEDSMYDSGSASATCSLKLQGLQVTDAGYDALNAALSVDTEEARGLQQESAAGMFMDTGDDTSVDASAENDVMEYALEDTVILKRADAKLVSYLRCDYAQFGGAHPMTSYNGRNYDAQTGKALSLKDVTTDYDGVYQYVLAELQQRQKNSDETGAMYFDDYETTVGQFFYGANGAPSADSESRTQDDEGYSTVNWYMTDDAVIVIFDIYSIAPYAAGASVVSVPVSSGLLNSQYFG